MTTCGSIFEATMAEPSSFQRHANAPEFTRGIFTITLDLAREIFLPTIFLPTAFMER